MAARVSFSAAARRRIALQYAKGASMAQIAKKLGRSITLVRRLLRDMKVRTRRPGRQKSKRSKATKPSPRRRGRGKRP